PYVTDLLDDLFGIQSPLPLYSFGLMVATALLVAAWLTQKELDRKYSAGLIAPVRAKVKDDKGRVREKKVSPSFYVWTLMGIAAVAGIVGSKLFNIIDFWDEFVQNPIETLFSGAGLTFYGGLILATICVAWYARHKKIQIPQLADSIAPGLIGAYGIGRIGCYLAGDGDWGLCSDLADKPAWIPGWLWSETFPRAYVFEQNPSITTAVEFNAQVRGIECTLPPGAADGVYPTMIYEVVLAIALGALLWALRKHPFKAGWLFSLYLVLQGVERFFIEFLRTNKQWALGLSQSQWISIGLVTLGVIGLVMFTKRVTSTPEPPAPEASGETAEASAA
ncbi:MAG: prolipoprotein diacylglyceryl transferase family protein, partial [Bacteroidota bacterium]